MNSCNFIGNLTRDPQSRETTGGKKVVNVGMALNRKVKGSDQTTFIELVAWEKTAEILENHFQKGSKIGVTCRVRQDSWEDKDSGEKRNRLVFDVEQVDFIDQKKNSEGGKKPSNPKEPEDASSGDVDDVPF